MYHHINIKREAAMGGQAMVIQKEETHLTEFTVHRQILLIHLREDLDHHNALWIRHEADKRIEQKGIRHIIFDFGGVEFMDSSGIGVIMGRYKKVIFIGGRIAAACVGGAADRILRLSGLYRIMDKYESVADAILAMNCPAEH